MPFMPGMRMSRKTRSGWCCSTSSTASVPFFASPTISSSGQTSARRARSCSRSSRSSSAMTAVGEDGFGCAHGSRMLRKSGAAPRAGLRDRRQISQPQQHRRGDEQHRDDDREAATATPNSAARRRSRRRRRRRSRGTQHREDDERQPPHLPPLRLGSATVSPSITSVRRRAAATTRPRDRDADRERTRSTVAASAVIQRIAVCRHARAPSCGCAWYGTVRVTMVPLGVLSATVIEALSP
jgi:hypothetical protein